MTQCPALCAGQMKETIMQIGPTQQDIDDMATEEDRQYDQLAQNKIDDEAEARRNEGAMLEGMDRLNEAIINLNFIRRFA